MANNEKVCLVILGMHRSGTSALAGVLYHLGVDFGRDLLPPAADNPKGFFENNRIVYQINDRLLHRLNSAWDDQFPLPDNWWQQEFIVEYRQRAVEILETEFGKNALFAIKDPRLCVLLPFWQQVFNESMITPYYLLVVRHPSEIAASLAQRDGFSYEKSAVLWLNAMLSAERDSRGENRAFISFDNLVTRPFETIDSIASVFALTFPKKVQAAADDIQAFVTPTLKRHSITDGFGKEYSPPELSQFYELLIEAANGYRLADEKLVQIDAIRQSFCQKTSWFMNRDLKADQIAKPLHHAQLFINTGQGFTEEQSIIKAIAGSETRLEFDISHYQNVVALRFNTLSNNRVVLKVNRFDLLDATQTRHSDLPYHVKPTYRADDLLIFDMCQPTFTIELPQDYRPSKVVVDLNYMAWGAEIYPYILRFRNAQIERQEATLKDQETKLREQEIALQQKELALRAAKNRVIAEQAEVAELEARLDQIYQTKAWRAVQRYWQTKQKATDIARNSYRSIIPLKWRLAFRDIRYRLRHGVPHPLSGISGNDTIHSRKKFTSRFTERKSDNFQPIKKITFIASANDPHTVKYRVENIIEGTRQLNIKTSFYHPSDLQDILVDLDSDLLILVRIALDQNIENVIQTFRSHRIPIVFDIDDLVFDENYIKDIRHLNSYNTEELEAFLDGVKQWQATLKLSDYVTCTTEFLANHIRQNFQKQAFIVKNTINAAEYKFVNNLLAAKRQPDRSTIRIGYLSGTTTHNNDWLEASDAVYQILQEFPSVELYLAGYLNIDPKFELLESQITRIPYRPIVEYLETLTKIDINIAPLELNNPFTAGKSELKIFEAALAGIPTVASAVDSYQRCITDGVNGFVAASKEEWYSKLRFLIDNPKERIRMGQQARQDFVQRYYIKNVFPDIVKTYEQITTAYRQYAPYIDPTELPTPLPKISVISVLYNKRDQLAYYLGSLFRQTYPGPVEIILVDDHSSDDSVDQATAFVAAAAKNRVDDRPRPTVTIIANEQNIGNCGSRNKGIRAASGDIIIVIDADCVTNKDFLLEHARAYAHNDVDVAIGPYNIETEGRDPFEVLEYYETHPGQAHRDANLQDPVNPTSFVNCITRNFSIRKAFIEGDLFDEAFAYSTANTSGFGWEDVDMGYRLYQRGARIAYLPQTVSIHVSHPPAIDDKTKALRSLANFRKLFEKHPDLLLAARRWALDTYQKICRWADTYDHPPNDDRQFLDHALQRFLPPPFYVKASQPKLNILTYRWHCAHQYELYKLPHQFTLVSGLGDEIAEFWAYDKRPMPKNAWFKHFELIDIREYDLAILHFDENVLAHYLTDGFISPQWGTTFRWFCENVISNIPSVAICHGTPQFKGQYNREYAEPDLMQPIETERQRLVDLLADTLVVTNSYQAQQEWRFKNSKVIWHGFDPAEFPPTLFRKGILSMSADSIWYRPHYNGWFIYREVNEALPIDCRISHLDVPEPHINLDRQSNRYAYSKFRNYVDELRQYSIYFNPTLRSPMPRIRGEAMMCGLAIVTTQNHDVEMFIKNGVNGFYSNNPAELREYLLYLCHNPAQAQKIGLAGRKTAIDLFNHDRYLQAWDQTILSMLS